MDNPDRDFESLLRQFRLREQRPFPEEAPVVEQRRGHRWAFAAAAVVVAMLVSIPLVRHFVGREVSSATVEIAGDSPYKTGEKISSGSPVRSGTAESAVIRLEDGTEMELRAQSEVLLKSGTGDTGIHVRLNSGSVLVTAAKQRAGQLYVETKDVVLSVVGTVFLVEAEPSGTSVGVIEGVVEVQQGSTVRRLSSGEQLSTEALRESRRLADSISWSRSSRRLAALLPSPPVITLAIPPTPGEPPALRRRVANLQGPQAEAPAAQQAPAQPPPPKPAPPVEPEQQPKSDAGANDPGKAVFARACGQCHRLEFMDNARNRSREDYQALVSRQVGYGAPVSANELQILVDYLYQTYGAQDRGFK